MARQVSPRPKVDFRYVNPTAKSVCVAGSFTDWEQHPIDMKKQKNGVWKKSISLPPGHYEYRLLVDGRWQDDPECPTRVRNPYGAENCVRIVS